MVSYAEEMTILPTLNNFISQSPRPGPDEIVDEEEDVTHPAVLTDDIMMSDQGSNGYASNNEEEILDFPESIEDEGHGMSDMDIDLDGIVSDLATPDVAMPEVVVLDVESYMTMRVTQVDVCTVNSGFSMSTGFHRLMRGVY